MEKSLNVRSKNSRMHQLVNQTPLRWNICTRESSKKHKQMPITN